MLPNKTLENMRSEYTARIDKLENEVLECCRKLKRFKKTQQQQLVKYWETTNHLCWQYDMSDFQFKNIRLHMEDRCVKLYAQREHQGQFLEINRKFVLPDNAETDLSAEMQVNGMLTIKAPLKKESTKTGHV